MLRARGCVLLAIPLIASLLPLGTPAAAASRTNNYSGQLDYGTFRRAAARDEGVTIRYSPGGTGAAAMALARVRNVVIDGACNSACAWSFVRNANACFTPRASFGFHAAHDPGTGRRMNAATSYWLQNVRPSLRGRLQPLLSSSSVIRVTAADMRRHYGERACGSKQNLVEAPAPSRRQRMASNARVKVTAGHEPGQSAAAERRVAEVAAKVVPMAMKAVASTESAPSPATLAALHMITRDLDAASIETDLAERQATAAFVPATAPDALAEAWEALHAQAGAAAMISTAAIAAPSRVESDAVCEFEGGETARTDYTLSQLSLP